jgi:ATP-dependent DNA helicase RecG
VNAVAHRDYFEKGAVVMLEIFDNRVEISNPGGLPKGLNPKDFGKRALARNPLIASLLNRVGYIEKLGTGIQRIRQAMELEHLPEPEFDFNSFFTVRLYRHNFTEIVKQEFSLNDKRSERLVFILRSLENNTFNVEQAAQNLYTTARTLRNDLELLAERGWIERIGSTKGSDYQLSDVGKRKLKQYV